MPLREGGCMHTINGKQLEYLRKRYPSGTAVCLDAMEGEGQMVDQFHKVSDPANKKKQEGPSR